MVAPGPLGWIEPALRTPEMHNAVGIAQSKFLKMALARPTLPRGTKLMLTDFWFCPEVLTDLNNIIFTGFHQLTGACVGVSDGDGVFTLSAVQRCVADAPTKAFIPWWPTSYGRSRAKSGIHGQGEGSIDSVMGQVMVDEGVDDALQAQFDTTDGFTLTKSLEMQWSDGNSSLVTNRITHTKQFPMGGLAAVEDVDGIYAGIVNGYPCLNGCNNYMGSASVRQTSTGRVALGTYNGRGGHSTTFLGIWEHPDLGTLFNYHNQWPGSTYPDDDSGKSRCSCWALESEVAKLFRTGGNNGETMLMSHLTYLPAQPKVLDWSTI